MRSCENDPVHARHNCLLCELCTPQGCQSPNAFANGRTSSNCGTLFDYYAGSVSRDQDSSRPYCGAFSGLGMLDADCFAIQTLGVGGYLQRFIMLITDLLHMRNRSCGIDHAELLCILLYYQPDLTLRDFSHQNSRRTTKLSRMYTKTYARIANKVLCEKLRPELYIMSIFQPNPASPFAQFSQPSYRRQRSSFGCTRSYPERGLWWRRGCHHLGSCCQGR